MKLNSMRKDAGMTLFEVILALALFTTAAVALVITINSIGAAAIEARNLRAVEQGLEGVMDEYSKSPQILELDKTLKAGKDGISYHVKIKAMDTLKNQDGVNLTNLFHVHVTATWKEDGEPLTMSAETVRYAGMYQPVQ
jgi:type II secretory pathway pseudopilin PulG